ncbi:MAG: hypothetical protein ABIT08_03950 [Bacteroidia bacterium]
MKTQYLIDGNGKKLGVFLSLKEYQRLLYELDELESIKAYDKAKKRKQEFIPFEIAVKEIRAKRKAQG